MKKISRNLIWMSVANIVSSIFNALIFIYLAKKLQAEAFGRFSFAQSVVFFVFNFIDLGLSTYGIREIAKNKSGFSEYVSNITSLRLIVASVLFAISFLALIIIPESLQIKALFLFMFLMLFSSALSTEWAFQGLEKMHMVFVSFTVTLILQAILLLLFVNGPHNLLKAPLIIFLTAQPIIIIFLRNLKFRFRLREPNLNSIKNYFRSSLVIWSISLFAQVYNVLDIFILGLFRPAGEVGYYSIGRRVVTGVIFFSMFLANAFLPRLSATFNNRFNEFRGLTRKFIKTIFLFAALLSIALFFFTDKFISFVFGRAYLPASLSLKILGAGAVLVLFNMPFSTGLIAAGREKDVLRQTVICAVLSVILNFMLIPKFGAEGASLVFFYVEALALTLILWYHYKRLGQRNIALEKTKG